MIEAEGVPFRMIAQESVRHDLLVIGKDTDFHFDDEPSIAEHGPAAAGRQRPAADRLPGDRARRDGPVLVAYDGSVRSSRALHMLALLGFVARPPGARAGGRRGAGAGDRAGRQAAELLAKHEHQVTPHGMHSHAEPADIICAQAATLGVGLIAMAAERHDRPIHDLFLGSTTETACSNACPCPLFVHH